MRNSRTWASACRHIGTARVGSSTVLVALPTSAGPENRCDDTEQAASTSTVPVDSWTIAMRCSQLRGAVGNRRGTEARSGQFLDQMSGIDQVPGPDLHAEVGSICCRAGAHFLSAQYVNSCRQPQSALMCNYAGIGGVFPSYHQVVPLIR
jgi:hypothetical protein